jgi:hypothetical protein
VREPGPRFIDAAPDEALALRVRVEPEHADVSYVWTLDGRPAAPSASDVLEFTPAGAGRHRVAVSVKADGRTIGGDAWVVSVREPKPPPTLPALRPTEVTRAETVEPKASLPTDVPSSLADAPITPNTVPTPPPTEPPAGEMIAAVRPSEPAAPAGLREAEVRAWLEEYARAWSRKDVAALQRMGQIRTSAEAEQLERYFRSVSELSVDVRVVAVRVDGERASVELERTDTVVDPSGRRQELRLPRMHKQIERTPEGLRFTLRGGQG